MDGVPPLYRVGTLTYTRPKLALLFFWLLWGDFCFVVMEAVTPSIMPLKLHGLGASNTLLALVMSTIPWTMGLFLNPIVSFRSDRFRSRWGRRIPFIFLSLPFLVVCLVGLGFGDRLGFVLHVAAGPWLARFSPEAVAIGVISVLLVTFTFFNWFVNASFWYLFNDVVPEHLLARFMSWFRVVGLLSAAFYNVVIFQFAETHTAEIFIGAAVLYLVGFGLMCLNVKEGQYPPAPAYEGGQTGVIAAVRTYARECHTLPHYWFQFLATAFGAIAGSGGAFMVFFYKEIGLGLRQIGTMNSCVGITSAVLFVGTGWLADRIHPMRVVIIGVLANLFVGLPIMLLWLFWRPAPEQAFWMMIAISIVITAPIAALVGVWDPPLFMRLFPRSRYGQFCSANSIWRSVGSILGSLSVGLFLDTMRGFVGETRAFLLLPAWQLVFSIPAAWMAWKLYQSWLRYGGDETYVPPVPALAPAESGETKPAVVQLS